MGFEQRVEIGIHRVAWAAVAPASRPRAPMPAIISHR
jgi:hypothetical protein